MYENNRKCCTWSAITHQSPACKAAELAGAVRSALDPWDTGAGAGEGAGAGGRARADKGRTRAEPEARALVQAAEQILQEADSQAGGFGRAPKFPHRTALEFCFALGGVSAMRRPPFTWAGPSST